MISAINSVGVLWSNNGLKRSKIKKTQTFNKTVEYSKVPSGFCPVSFKGNFVNYGDKLYIGCSESKNSPIDRAKAEANYVDLQGKNLSNYSFENSHFYRADLRNTVLENTIFDDSNMWAAKLSGALACSTTFRHVNFCDADLSGAKFDINTNMLGANLMGADLRNTDLSCVNLNKALYNETTQFPTDFNPKTKGMILLHDGSDFSDSFGIDRFEYAKMRYLSINDVNFANNSFKRADLKACEMNGCNFKNANLTRAYAREMKATDCDFSGAKMKQTNFDNAEFTNVDMSNADLRSAIFTFKSSKNLNLQGAIFDQYTEFNSDFRPLEHGMIYKRSESK